VNVFVTGGTGYLGAPLVRALIDRRHSVTALARRESAVRLPPGCRIVIGDALDRRTRTGNRWLRYVRATRGRAASESCEGGAVPHDRSGVGTRIDRRGVSREFVYVSVAQPAPIMKAYQATRAEAESALRATRMPATILRPWYVLGPGHRWPYLIVPVYWVLEILPPTRAAARRLALVTHAQMIDALLWSVENPTPSACRVIEAAPIKRGLGYS
jgi:uncharacterized protein YbjT (DUF2867 family)